MLFYNYYPQFKYTHPNRVRRDSGITSLLTKRCESDPHPSLNSKYSRNIIDNFCESGVVVTPAREESFVAIDYYKGTEKSDLFVLRAHVMDLITKNFLN